MPTSARQHTVFTEIFRKSVIAQWVDVGIDPYESTGGEYGNSVKAF